MWTSLQEALSKAMGLVPKSLSYLKKGMSNDSSVSSTRWIQLIIVTNIVGMLWFLLMKVGISAASTLSVWRDVAIALIVNGLAIHVATKYTESKGVGKGSSDE